jgi:hypothetical protein
MKMMISCVHNLGCARRYWRSQFNYLVYALTFASFVVFKSDQEQDIPLATYFESLLKEGRTKKICVAPNPTNEIPYSFTTN